MAFQPRAPFRPGNYASTQSATGSWHSPTDGPSAAANINQYKMDRSPGMFGPSMMTERGGAHSPTGSLQASANLSRHIHNARIRNFNNSTGGRWDKGAGGLAGYLGRGSGGSRLRPRTAPGGSSQVLPNFGAATPPSGAMFSPEVMQRMTNRNVEQAFTAADMRNAQKPYMGRGMSLDEGTQANAIPRVSDALGSAAYSSRVQPLFDYLANQQFGLRQQQLRNAQLSPLLSMLG